MKTTQRLLVGLVIVAVVCGAAAFGYLGFETVNYTGERAIAQMNSEELAALKRVALIHAAMDAAQVYAVLGDPTADVLLVAKWENFGGSRLSQLRIYFYDGHPRKVRWFKLGYFVYEKEL